MTKRLWFVVLIVGIVFVVAAALLITRGLRAGPAPAFDPRETRLSSATVLNDDQPLPAFSLSGHAGNFDNARLSGRWTLMFFGYTYCPDICPTALTLLKGLKAKIDAEKLASPQVVMVSVDSARDSPSVLESYTAAFDSSFLGASGSDAALAPLVKHLGVYYLRHDQDKTPHYVVDHSTAIYLIDPGGRLKAVFSAPQDVDKMLTDYRVLTR